MHVERNLRFYLQFDCSTIWKNTQEGFCACNRDGLEVLTNRCRGAITRVCHLQSENGAHWDSIFRCKYAIFLVFTGLENF